MACVYHQMAHLERSQEMMSRSADYPHSLEQGIRTMSEQHGPYSRRRLFIAISVFLVVVAIAFGLLFCRWIEGGPFVSMLVLATALSMLVLLWERIGEVSVFGAKIALRDLTYRAEKTIDELSQSRASLLKTSLILAQKHSGGYGDPPGCIDPRSETVLDIVDQIDKAGLLDVLAREVFKASNSIIEATDRRIRQASSISPILEASNSRAPETIIPVYQAHALEDDAHLKTAVGQLQKAIAFRDRAKACLV